MELPRGDVTFLFTDIEGSTALARRLGDGFTELLETHRALIRGAVEERGGHVVDTRADETFAVFAEADAAVAAAVAAQAALAGHSWAEGLEPRVRMGLHAGTARLDANAYVGLDVHRGARVCEAAAGGQILVSSSVRARANNNEDVQFADLGEHRLPGFPEKERIFQVLHHELSQELLPPAADGPSKGELMRVVIADDSVLLREGIAKLLEDAGSRSPGSRAPPTT